MHHEYFPEEFIALQQELQHHPILIERLQKHKQEDQEIVIAEIAAYCEVILDGVYVPEQLVHLAGILAKKLYERRPAGPGIILC